MTFPVWPGACDLMSLVQWSYIGLTSESSYFWLDYVQHKETKQNVVSNRKLIMFMMCLCKSMMIFANETSQAYELFSSARAIYLSQCSIYWKQPNKPMYYFTMRKSKKQMKNCHNVIVEINYLDVPMVKYFIGLFGCSNGEILHWFISTFPWWNTTSVYLDVRMVKYYFNLFGCWNGYNNTSVYFNDFLETILHRFI